MSVRRPRRITTAPALDSGTTVRRRVSSRRHRGERLRLARVRAISPPFVSVGQREVIRVPVRGRGRRGEC
jgi:hypothetical protein